MTTSRSVARCRSTVLLMSLLLLNLRHGHSLIFSNSLPKRFVARSFSQSGSPLQSKLRITTYLASKIALENQLNSKELDFAIGYLNKHHPDLLLSFVLAFSKLGTVQAKKNAFSGGSYKVINAELKDIDFYGEETKNEESHGCLILDATVKIRGKEEVQKECVTISLDAFPVEGMKRDFKTLPIILPTTSQQKPIEKFIRRMNRLCLMVNQPSVTGKLIQLGIQVGDYDKTKESPLGFLKEDMFLNQVPHNRFVRGYFYDMASKAALEAVVQCSNQQISNRMVLTCLIPELNTSMDSYRIGTLLEMVRKIAITLAEQNLRVRICVQASMGVGIFTGLPKSLSGVPTLLQRMDWQAQEGEENEGMLGNYINFGEIGANHVVNSHTKVIKQSYTNDDGKQMKKQEEIQIFQDDVFLLICPQSMVGLESSIIGPLQEMVEAVGDRPIILINPDLSDKVSSQGQQSVRGRKDRMEFVNTFKSIFHFQNIYYSGTSYFPILGAISKSGPSQPWVALQRRDLVDGRELYVPALSTETKPDGRDILQAFEKI